MDLTFSPMMKGLLHRQPSLGRSLERRNALAPVILLRGQRQRRLSVVCFCGGQQHEPRGSEIAVRKKLLPALEKNRDLVPIEFVLRGRGRRHPFQVDRPPMRDRVVGKT